MTRWYRNVSCKKGLGAARLFGLLCVCIGLLLGGYGCGKPGGSRSDLTNSTITITAINNNEVLKSDVLNDGHTDDDIVTVEFSSQPQYNIADIMPTELSDSAALDTVTFHSYHVSHVRSDDGPNPADFTLGFNVAISPPKREYYNEIVDARAVEAEIVVVRAFDKERSPLRELRDVGQIVTTATITFYGQDGYGNDVYISSSLTVSFGNYFEE